MKDRKHRKKGQAQAHNGNHGNNHNHDERLKSYEELLLTNDGGIHGGVGGHGVGGEMMGAAAVEEMPTRGQMICDPANICTLMGVMLSSFAMAAMWKGNYDLGMGLNLIGNIADIIDGPIARSTPQRPLKFSILGAKLDTYSDLISHFVVPASLLMNISSLDFMYVGLATLWVVTGIIRQSYFEVMRRCDRGACVFGVASDYMPPLFGLTLHLIPLLDKSNIKPVVLPFLAACTLFMIYGSLTFSLKTRHYDNFGLVTSTVYNFSLAFSLFLMMLYGSFHLETPRQYQSWEGFSLAFHLLLAYPCYFRFIEFNF